MVVVVCSFRIVPCLRPNNSQQKLPDYEIYRDNDDDYVLYVNVCIFLILLYDKKNEPSRLSLSSLTAVFCNKWGWWSKERNYNKKLVYLHICIHLWWSRWFEYKMQCHCIIIFIYERRNTFYVIWRGLLTKCVQLDTIVAI